LEVRYEVEHQIRGDSDFPCLLSSLILAIAGTGTGAFQLRNGTQQLQQRSRRGPVLM